SSRFFFLDPPTTYRSTRSLHDALPILPGFRDPAPGGERHAPPPVAPAAAGRRRGRTGPPLRRAMGGFPRVLSAADALRRRATQPDRKSTRLNSSHVKISYAVFCLKKKT